MPHDLDHPDRVELGAQATVPGDAELLQRYARDRDDAAFAALVERHIELVFSAALRQSPGDHQRAQDVTQLVFAELARKAARLQDHPALSGWLYTTTRFVARNAVRAEERRVRRERMALGMNEEPDQPNPHELEPSWAKIAGVLDEAMHELSESDRTAVVLRHFEDRPYAEIGQRLGLSPNTARMRTERALDRLRERLSKRGIVSTSVALASAMTANAVHTAPAGLAATVVSTSLAAATGAGASAVMGSLFTTLVSMKSKLILGGLAATLVSAPLLWQHNNVTRLQRELTAASASLRSSSESEAALRQSLELASAENQRLRDSRTELLRLRGEIGPLREQLRALTRPTSPATPQPPPTALAPNSQPSDTELSDVGASTAVHAAKSLIWAVSAGNVDRLTELLELPAGVAPEQAQHHYAFFANQLSNVFRGMDFNGWRLNVSGTTNEDVVRLNYGYRDLESGKDDTFGFMLHRHDDGWKVMVEGEVPETF